MFTRCPHCPVPDGERCCAESDGRYRFVCKPGMTASERAAVLALSGSPAAAPEPAPPPAVPASPRVAAALALLRLARECLHREEAECGCAFAKCGRDGGKSKAVQECLACVGGALDGVALP